MDSHFKLDSESPSGLTRIRNGKVAGTLDKSRKEPRWRVNFKGKLYYNYRIIYWLYNKDFDIHDKSIVIDHIDGNPLNNSIDNLRAVTQQENTWNNTKAKGYFFSKHLGKFCTQFRHKHLGVFDSGEKLRKLILKRS